MANIAITNYCNLKCDYCFASEMIQNPNKTMSLDNYLKVAKYLLEQNNQKYIGIIGGEPSLHPNFKQILIESNQLANQYDANFTLFTNGIELEPFLSYIGTNIHILINCNNYNNMTVTQMKKFRSTIEHLRNLGWLYNKKVTLGCNLHLNETKYEWFWDLIDLYKITKLRYSIVSPGGLYNKERTNKDDYFKKMKIIFLNFCKEAEKRHIQLIPDCGYIPSCYFSSSDLDLIKKVTKLKDLGCDPVMDITPDLFVTPCFGLYIPIPLDFNKNWDGFIKYVLYNYNIPKALNNNQGPCATCEKLQNFQCQGGCLAFSSPE